MLIALVGCGRVAFDVDGDGGGVIPCDEPWSAPFSIDLGPNVLGPSIRGDGLELFAHNATGLTVAKRASRSVSFSGTPMLLPMPPNTQNPTSDPSISDDGLELFFAESNMGNVFTWHSLRDNVNAPWQTDEMIGILGDAEISHDRLTMYTSEFMVGIRSFQRDTLTSAFGSAMLLPAIVNQAGAMVGKPSISADDLDLYFWRDPGSGSEAWVAHRHNRTAEFSAAERLDIPNFLQHPDISEDGHFLYYTGIDLGLWAISRCEL